MHSVISRLSIESFIFYIFFISYIFCGVCMDVSDGPWPVPYQRFKSRPRTNPFCQAQYTFCPTGLPPGNMPQMSPNDKIEIFALKAPVWEFKYGDLLAKAKIMHDAIGFRNTRTGANYTMEWYELFQLLNCTFPHLLSNKTLFWCNQGASCIYSGIDDKHWKQNGTLVKVAEMTGKQFDKFAQWALWDNRTGIYYETWTVEEKPGAQMWFDSYDCASFVIRAFQFMGQQLGVQFNRSVSLNYTRIHLYSDKPIFLGNDTIVSKNASLRADMIQFYSLLQPHLGVWKMIENLLHVFFDVTAEKKFYFFYNFEYWLLPMKSPYIGLTYLQVPLP